MAKKKAGKGRAADSAADSPAASSGQPQPIVAPPSGMPFGTIPVGTRYQALPQFGPELASALKRARDESGGRYLILVLTADDPKADPHNVRLHYGKGPEWSDDWLIRGYRLIAGEFLKITPAMLGRIEQHPTPPAGG